MLAGLVQANAAEKIGVVDVQSIFQALPQAASIQQDIASEFKDKMEEIQRIEKDLQYYLEKKKRDTATMSEAEIKELDDKLRTLGDDYKAKAQPLREQMQGRAAEERNKILALIKQSVDTIAAEEKYDLILNAGAVAFIDDSKDLTQKVIDKVSKIK
ncbi:OmpH family outer membrane protein [Alteromonas sp. a30]|nr:OmpH family outer membrane protein [Alteromonas sp. a30]